MTLTSGALRWRSTMPSSEGDVESGLEHVELKVAESGVSAEGVAITDDGATDFGLRWRMTVDPDWACVRSLHLTRLGGPTVALRHDGYGEWSDGEGRKRPEFTGLTDCLVEGSPFGLVALLKRLGAKASKSQTVDVVTVTVPDFAIARTSLTLQPIAAGRLRLIRGDRSDEIEIDGDGLILRWGDRIRRLGPASRD